MRTQTLTSDKIFKFESGETISNIEFCYTSYGDYDKNKKKVLLLGGLSSSSEIHTWWKGFHKSLNAIIN